MSNPPNRIGGIRGPNGATLDDVVSELAGMRDILSALVGPLPLPATWPGLTRAIGNPADEANTTVLGWHALLYARLGLVLQKLGPVEGAAYLAAILSTLEDGIAPDAASTATSSAAIAAALPGIGTLLTDIEDNTRRSAECCEEGGGPGGEEPPPENTCPAFEPQLPCSRITGWVTGPDVVFGGTNARIYYPQWPNAPVTAVPAPDSRLFNLSYTHPNGFQYRAVFGDADVQADYIVRWDFTGGIEPLHITVNLESSNPFDDAEALDTSGIPKDYGDNLQGAYVVFLEAPPSGATRYITLFLFEQRPDGTYPSATEIGLNVWQGAEIVSAS